MHESVEHLRRHWQEYAIEAAGLGSLIGASLWGPPALHEIEGELVEELSVGGAFAYLAEVIEGRDDSPSEMGG